MSLATRCTSCGTVFRVVQDQLKVSEGWVRCGRCDEVFNAIAGLFDLERDAPPDWTPPPAPPAPPAAIVTAAFHTPSKPPEDDEEVFHLSDDDRIHSRFFQPEQEDVAQTPAQALAERDRLDFADARFNDALIADTEADAAAASHAAAAAKAPRKRKTPAADGSHASGKQSPEFLLAARRKARWRTPEMRLALLGAALLLSLMLVGQMAFHFRDVVAARWPGTRPLLAQTCVLMKCSLGLPRRIDDISVESSALSPANNGAAYKLSVVLRNRNSLTLAMPSIDLSLTDSAGQLVSRKALSAADFRLSSAALAPNSETSLQLLMSTDGRRVSGYTVEIFYP